MKKKLYILRGFTLIEILLVLSVIAALSAAFFFLYLNVNESYKINKESNNIMSIKGALDKLGFQSNNLNDDTISLLNISANSKTNKNNKILDAWGNPISISSYKTNYYTISYQNMNPESCSRLLKKMGGIFNTVSVNNSDYEKSSDISSNCSSENNLSTNTLSFSNYKLAVNNSNSDPYKVYGYANTNSSSDISFIVPTVIDGQTYDTLNSISVSMKDDSDQSTLSKYLKDTLSEKSNDPGMSDVVTSDGIVVGKTSSFGCGSNSLTVKECGSMNTDDYINALISAPESAWDDSVVKLNSYNDKICKNASFTCTEIKDANSYDFKYQVTRNKS